MQCCVTHVESLPHAQGAVLKHYDPSTELRCAKHGVPLCGRSVLLTQGVRLIAGVEGIGSVGGNWAALKAQLSVVPKRFRWGTLAPNHEIRCSCCRCVLDLPQPPRWPHIYKKVLGGWRAEAAPSLASRCLALGLCQPGCAACILPCLFALCSSWQGTITTGYILFQCARSASSEAAAR